MGLQNIFDKAILKSSGNIVGTHMDRTYMRPFYGPCLSTVVRIADAGLDAIEYKHAVLRTPGDKPPIFKVRRDSSPLGIVVAVRHTSGSEIQFACPRDNTSTLLLSVSRPNSPVSSPADIYDYTGNIDAANERFVEWLAEVAPQYKDEISDVLARLEAKPSVSRVVIAHAPHRAA